MSKKATRFSRDETIYNHPHELLQNLIRFDTTNPPGNEAECVKYINTLLTDAGFETIVLFKDENRPNLIARLKGKGSTAPLLLHGHVDVVTTAHQKWTHPPFEAEIEDGYIWGRGALDMKGGVAMMLAAFLRAKAEHLNPSGDVIFAIVSDEEALGDYGAKFLVENHAEYFKGVRYAIGEGGGFSFYISKKKFYPMMVSEKRICHMKAVIRGPGGHGAFAMHGGAMAKLGKLLQQLDTESLPAHVTPVVKQMIEEISSSLGFPSGFILRQLLRSTLTNRMLKLLGKRGKTLEPLFRNMVNATIVHGGEKFNVIPSEITLELDGRILPGSSPEEFMAELHQIIGDEVELEVIRHEPGPAEPDMGLFNLLSEILKEADPDGKPLPLLMPGVSDARFFSRLGIQTYGFTPMKLPPDFEYLQTVHAADERIPTESVSFGAEAIYKVLQRFQEGK